MMVLEASSSEGFAINQVRLSPEVQESQNNGTFVPPGSHEASVRFLIFSRIVRINYTASTI
jgi:hypothetical protein